MPVVPRKLFLTKVQLDIYDPAKIDDDFVFTFAGEDTAYREVEIRYEFVRAGAGEPRQAGTRRLFLVGIGTLFLLLVGIAACLLAVRSSLKRP